MPSQYAFGEPVFDTEFLAVNPDEPEGVTQEHATIEPWLLGNRRCHILKIPALDH